MLSVGRTQFHRPLALLACKIRKKSFDTDMQGSKVDETVHSDFKKGNVGTQGNVRSYLARLLTCKKVYCYEVTIHEKNTATTVWH